MKTMPIYPVPDEYNRIADIESAQDLAFREYLIRAEYARDEALTYGRAA